MVHEGTVFEQVIPESDASEPAGGDERRDQRRKELAKLDRRFAWIVTCTPPLGFIVGVILWINGNGPGWLGFGLLAAFYLVSLIGVEVGFHRLFSHRSFQTYRWIRVLLATTGSFAFQGPVIWWAATHRRHHQHSDKPGDPHSPNLSGKSIFGRIAGLYHAHFGWLFEPESTRALGWDLYVRDLYRERAIFRIHVSYFFWLAVGFVLPAILGGLLTWSWNGVLIGFLWGGLARVFIMNHVFYWCINSVTHAFGTRPFKSNDLSTNNIWLAIPTLGQSWHNNHHAFPGSAVTQYRWWEIDLAGMFIRVLEFFRLAWDVKYPSKQMQLAKRVDIKETPSNN